MQILTIGELERLARLYVVEKTSRGISSLIILIELSKSNDWQPLTPMINSMGLSMAPKTAYLPLVELGLVEFRRVTGPGAQFDSIELKIRAGIDTQSNAYNIDLMQDILRILITLLEKHKSVTARAILFLLAFKVRKIIDSKEISRFMDFGDEQQARNSCSKMLNIFTGLGIVHAVKTGDYQKAPVMIFEVEQ